MGGSRCICAPLRQRGWGLGRVPPPWGGGGRCWGRALRTQGPRPRPRPVPPHPSRPGAGLPVAMAAPPMGSVAMAMAPLFGSSVLQQPPPPRGGVRTGPPGGSHTTCGRGMGLGARGCSRPKQPTAPFPCAWCRPSGGAPWGPAACRGWTRCGGCRGSGLGAGGGRVWGQLCLWGRFGWGLWCRGGGDSHRSMGSRLRLALWVLASCSMGSPALGRRVGPSRGTGLSPPGGRAVSPSPVSPLLPCLAPAHVSPASPRWR